MTVSQKHHRHFVARRGEVLRQIGEEFGGVIVSFPRAGVNSEEVIIKLVAVKCFLLKVASTNSLRKCLIVRRQHMMQKKNGLIVEILD